LNSDSIQQQKKKAAPLPTVQALTDRLADKGDRAALVVMAAEGHHTWSYARLADTVHRLATGLSRRGIGPGDHVGLLAENRPEWIAACLAVLHAGATVMPLDVQLGHETLAHILEDSGARLLFTTGEQAERLSRLPKIALPDLVLFDAAAELNNSYQQLLASDAPSDSPPRRPEDPAALFYTSGTTGPPKGVPLTQGNLAFQVNTVQETHLVTSLDRVLLPLPFHHVYPFVIGLLVPLGLGLPVILPRGLTGPQILRAIREGEATAVIGVPRLYQALYTGIKTQATGKGRLAGSLFTLSTGASTWLRRRLGLRLGKYLLAPLHRQFGPSLRMLASGGSALDPELAWKLEGLGWEVAIGYGLTETAPLLTINPPGAGRLESVGRPVPGVELRIDPGARPEAAGQESGTSGGKAAETGEVLARGPNVFRGYRHLPAKTAESFTADGWFRTGDLGWFDQDRFLYLQGRASTLIVTASGKNIQPDEVEDFYAAHPFINESGILHHRGRLAAVIIPELAALRGAGEKNIEEAIRRAVSEQSRRLPSYQRLDEYAVSRDALPRTRLGKIRRHLLLDRYRQALAEKEPGKVKAGPISLAEMSDHDRSLLELPAARTVWDWLAGRHPAVRLTPDTSPHLDLGIDSLEWLNLSMEIGQQTGVELTEEAIGRIETVRDLLQEVTESAEQGRKGTSPARPLEQPEEVIDEEQRHWLKPLNPAQLILARGLYFINKMMMRGLFRLQVKGLNQLPREQFVLTPNHVSFLDPFIIAAALPFEVLHRTYYAGWTGVAFRNILFRFISRLAKAIPIDPQRALVSSLALAAMVLKQGGNLIWFPEGERSRTGELLNFRPGIGMLLNHYQVRVVPAFIRGAYEALPPHRYWPKFRKIAIDFGIPAAPADLARHGQGEQPQDRITSSLFDRVAALRDRSEDSD
jgi:long-chain acyl-CoA synthetase